MISNRPSYADKMTNLKYAIMGLSGKTEREAQDILNTKYNLYKEMLMTIDTGALAIWLIVMSRPKQTNEANYFENSKGFSGFCVNSSLKTVFKDNKIVNLSKPKNRKRSTNSYVNRDLQITTGQDMYGNPYTGGF